MRYVGTADSKQEYMTKNKIIEITGEIPSKKNSKQIFRSSAGKPFIVSSDNYLAWEENQLWLLKKHKMKKIVKCEKIWVQFYFKYDRRKDLSNVWESIGDLLVKAEILADDNFKVIPNLELEYGGKSEAESMCQISIINPEYE